MSGRARGLKPTATPRGGRARARSPVRSKDDYQQDGHQQGGHSTGFELRGASARSAGPKASVREGAGPKALAR